jgi:hypothetical protein
MRERLASKVKWEYSDDVAPDELGFTDLFSGKIYIRPGLTGRDLTGTVLHERLHQILTPVRGPYIIWRPLNWLRQYPLRNIHSYKYLEEFSAELMGTHSFRRAAVFPLKYGYINVHRAMVEIAAMTRTATGTTVIVMRIKPGPSGGR